MHTGRQRLVAGLFGPILALALTSPGRPSTGAYTPSGTAVVDVELALSIKLFNGGRYEEAAKQAQQALDQATRLNDESRKNLARYFLGLACVQLGEYTIAETLLSQVLPTGSSDNNGYTTLGETLLASMYFVEFRRLRAQTSAVAALVGDKRLSSSIAPPPKSIDEFANVYGKALSGPNASALDLVALAIIQDVRGYHSIAEGLLLRAAQTQRQSLWPPVARAMMYVGAATAMQLGDNATVERILAALIKADETTAGYDSLTVATDLNVLAGLEARNGNWEKAEQYVHRALAIDARDQTFRIPYVTSLNYQAAILAAGGDSHQAETELNESLRTRGPDLADNAAYRADAQYDLSQLYWDQGRFFEATQQFLDAAKVYATEGYEQQTVAVFLSYSRVAAILGKSDVALQTAKAAADYMVRVHSQDDPNYLQVLDQLGIVYMRSGDLTNAQRTFEQASEVIAMHPSLGTFAFADLNVNYAYVLAEQGHYDAAKQLITETIAKENAINPKPVDSLLAAWKTAAWIYARGDDHVAQTLLLRKL